MLWGIRRLLPCRRPRIDSIVFHKLKDLHLLKPFRGNKGRFKNSGSYLNNIPVRITTRITYRPSLLLPQHNSNIKLPIVNSVNVNKHMAQHNSNIKLPIVNSANVNKHMAQRNLTDVKKVISPPLLKCSLVNCRSVKKKISIFYFKLDHGGAAWLFGLDRNLAQYQRWYQQTISEQVSARQLGHPPCSKEIKGWWCWLHVQPEVLC